MMKKNVGCTPRTNCFTSVLGLVRHFAGGITNDSLLGMRMEIDHIFMSGLGKYKPNAALVMQDRFRANTVSLPNLLLAIFDESLYARPLASSRSDFLTHLLNDQIKVGDNNDAMIGGSGDDILDGGSGNDFLRCVAANDNEYKTQLTRSAA